MPNEEFVKCKTKDCENPVLDGKYCNNCMAKRREKMTKIGAVAGSIGMLVLSAVAKVITKGK